MKRKVIMTLGTILLLGSVGCSSKQETAVVESMTETAMETESTTEETSSTEEGESVTEETTTEEKIEKREDATFRNAVWGDDIETVKKYEEIQLIEEDGELLGETTVSGLDTYVIYSFDADGKLYNGGYMLKLKEGVGSGAYISDYNNLKDDLTTLYGEPVSDEIIPLEKQSTIDMAGAESALEYGWTVYRTIWNTGNTKIMLGMQGQEYTINTIIQYQDINYQEDLSESGL